MIGRLRSYLSGSSLGSTLIKAVTGSAGLRIVGMAFGFLVGVQLARGLGAEGYGIYGLAMSTVALLTVPTEFGLPQLLTREVAATQVRGDLGRMKGILRWSSRLSLMISALIGVGVVTWLLASGLGLSSSLGLTLLIGVLMIPIAAQAAMYSAALRGLQHIVAGQLPDVLVRPMLHSILLLLLPWLLLPVTPELAMGLGLAAAAVALSIAIFQLKGRLPDGFGAAQPVFDVRAWWSSALPMALTEGMRLIQGHALILILGVMMAVSDVGIYRTASSTMLLVAMPISLFNIVCMPVIARLHANGEKQSLQKMLGWVAAGTTLGVLALALPFLVAGDWLLASVFGAEFGEGGAVMRVFCLALLVEAAFGLSAALLSMTGLQNRVTRASVVAVVILLLSSGPLILLYGKLGAAFSYGISLLGWKLMMWRDVVRLLGLDTSIASLRLGGRSSGVADG